MSIPAALTLRVGLALLGASLFASGVEVVLHESGHVLAAWLLGAEVVRFDVHPFRRSEVAITYDGGRRSESSLLFASAGILFAVSVSILAFAATRSRSLYLLPITFLLPQSLFAEGSYLIDGTLSDYGDPSAIASLAGLPAGLMVTLGCLMVFTGIASAVHLIARAGVNEEAPWWFRGIAFFALVSVILPGAFYSNEPPNSWPKGVLILAIGAGILLVISLCAGLTLHLLRKRLSWLVRDSGASVSWAHAMTSLAAGLSVAGILLVSSHR